MTAHVWEELDLAPPAWVTRPQPAAEKAPAPRPWPPVLMGDYLHWSPSCAVTVAPATPLGQVVDFLAIRRDNVVAVAAGGAVLGTLFEDQAMEAVREHGMQALDMPVSDLMEASPWCCDTTDSPYVVVAGCEDRGKRRVPIVSRGRIVAAADLHSLRTFLRDHEA